MIFLDTRNMLIPTMPFSISSNFGVWMTSRAVPGWSLGSLSIEPFLGKWGGAWPRGSRDLPPTLKPARPSAPLRIELYSGVVCLRML